MAEKRRYHLELRSICKFFIKQLMMIRGFDVTVGWKIVPRHELKSLLEISMKILSQLQRWMHNSWYGDVDIWFGFVWLFYVDQRTEQSINSSSRLFPLSQVSIDQSQVKFSTNAKKNYKNISLKIKTAKMLAHGAIWGLNCFVVSTMSSFFSYQNSFFKTGRKIHFNLL